MTTLVNALDRYDALPDAAKLRAYSYDLLRLRPGDHVVDVGCGTGRAVGELVERGMVATGVDHDPAMVELAWQRHMHGHFRVADAEALPFADGELAGYRADKVLHDLADPAMALAEAHRVLRSRGRVVVVDIDWDSIIIAGDDPVRTRQLVHSRTDRLNFGFAAREAPRLFRRQGFTDVHLTAHHEVSTEPDLMRRIAGDDANPQLVVIPILVTAATKA